MSIPNKIPYDTLFDLWREWLSQDDWMALDKWLKNQLKSKTRAQSISADTPSNNRELGLCMISAMRYLQLACAMEASYKDQELSDWNQWDKNWLPKDVKKISQAGFWYWIALREDPEIRPAKTLRDAKERKSWFDEFKTRFSNSDQLEHILLWSGLRPTWAPVLEQRRQKSGWSSVQLIEFIAQQNTTPPLWLRIQKNDLPEDACKKLRNEGVDAALDTNEYLFAKGGKHLSATSSHKEGRIEIQDLASQQIALAVDVKPGQKVWDSCAGAGGKSLAIASRMNNKGVIVATDLHEYKLDELKRRAKRAEFSNIRTFTWSGDQPLRLPKEVAQQQGFDWVLVDAPCSSSGTWRRNPDARWRFNEADTAELITLQQQILTNAAKAVRANGHLVYATCSWQVSENETQVDWFIKNNPEFAVQSQAMLGAPLQDSDAMFVAVLKKI